MPALAVDRIDRLQSTRHCIESGGKDNDVQIVVSAGGLDAAGGHPFDRRLANVDQRHVRLIEGRVIAGLDAEALGGDRISSRQQLLRERRVLYLLANPPANIVGNDAIRVLVCQYIDEYTGDAEPSLFPKRIENTALFSFAEISRLLAGGRHVVAGEAALQFAAIL